MPGNPLTDPNWADDTTDTVVRVVDQIRSKTTRPAVLAARGLVYGILAAFLGLLAVVLLLIILTRAVQAGFEALTNHERGVYLSYFFVGGILSIGGLLLFRKRNTGSAD